MKIFIFTKRKIIIIFLILCIIMAYFLYKYLNRNVQDIYIDLECNSMEFEDWKKKVDNLIYGEEKTAYLTFDDGPNNTITPKVLDILKEKDIKASFFVIGKYVEEYPEIVKREYEEGHYIANHSYNHDNTKLYKSAESFKNEIEKTDIAIGKAIGVENYSSHIFRFPNGFMAPLYKEEKKALVSILEKMDYTYIDWNCLNNDSMKKYTNSQLINNLKESSKNKNTLVILMHDTKDVSNSSLVLKESIEFLQEQGYEFKNFNDI